MLINSFQRIFNMENDGANAWRTAAKFVGWIAIVLNLLGLFINEENDQIDVIEIFVLSKF